MFKKTKIKIGAAIASSIMLAGAVGTAAGMINNNQSSHTVLKSSKTIENANVYNQTNDFALNTSANQSQNSFQTLNNTVLPKNFFSQNQLNQISNLINKENYNVQGNCFAVMNFEQTKKEKFMHNVEMNVINHIQQYGLQKNGLTNILVNKYHVSKLWLESNNKTQSVSIFPTNYLKNWISWNFNNWLTEHGVEATCGQFNIIGFSKPWNFYQINVNGKQLSHDEYNNFIKSVRLVSISNGQYNVQINTQPNVVVNNSINDYNDGGLSVSTTIVEYGSRLDSKNLQEEALKNKINVLIAKLHTINSNTTNSWDFNADYIKQGLELVQQEKNYILDFSKNSEMISQAKNLYNQIYGKYEWILKYKSLNWDANSIYKDFQSLVRQMQNLYETQFNSPTNTEKQILESKINALKLQIKEKTIADEGAFSGIASLLNDFYMLKPDKLLMQLKRNLAWDERLYIINYLNVNNQVKNQVINLWNEINTYYNNTLNEISMGDIIFFSYSIFNGLIKRIENLCQTLKAPEKMGLAVMKHAESVVNKYAEEMKGIAIASSVATGIGIALAAGYWVSAFFDFGATVPDAIAATTSAAATTVAMGCMWATYSETNELAKKIEGGIVNWTYYLATAYGAKGLFFKSTWLSFKNLFTSRMTYIVNYTNGVITTELGVIDACAWADPLLTVIGTINELFAISITVAKIAINGVNNSWLNLVY